MRKLSKHSKARQLKDQFPASHAFPGCSGNYNEEMGDTALKALSVPSASPLYSTRMTLLCEAAHVFLEVI